VDTDLAECAGCLCLASRKAARTITRAFDRRLRAHGIRATQFSVLVMLALRGPTMIGDLAVALGVDRTTLSRNVVPIEANRWIRSRSGQADARSRVLEITAAGRAMIVRAQPAWRAAQEATAAAIGGAGAAALLRLSRHPIG
jgi:DNA-binding MarR family transcriptional regulator